MQILLVHAVEGSEFSFPVVHELALNFNFLEHITIVRRTITQVYEEYIICKEKIIFIVKLLSN